MIFNDDCEQRPHLENAAKTRGIGFESWLAKDIKITPSADTLIYKGKPVDPKVLPKMVLLRSGLADKNLHKYFNKLGARVINSETLLEYCDDKMLMHQAMDKHGIYQPKTRVAVAGDTYDKVKKEFGATFVAKDRFGYSGRGCFLVKSKADFEKAMASEFKDTMLFQQYIEVSKGTDLRTYVIDGKIVGAVIRRNPDDFRSNVDLGGSAELCEITPELAEASLKIAKILDGEIITVDYLIEKTKGGKTLYPFCEANSNGGIKSFLRHGKGIEIAEQMMDYVAKQLNKVNVYYLGRKTSDIAKTFDANTSDDYFAGSITAYGDNANGNVSYNVLSGMQLCDDDSIYGDRNLALYSKFFGDQCREIASRDPQAKFFPYSNFFGSLVPKELADRVICQNDPKVISQLESKFNFKKLIAGKIAQADYEIMTGEKVLKLIESGEVPAKRQVVIQTEYGAAGEGTYFATRQHKLDINKIEPKRKYVVSEFIENTISVSSHFLVTANEVAIYPPGIQIMDGPAFIGSDVHAFSLLENDIKDECLDATRTYGELLRKKHHNLRGYFGLDMIVKKEQGLPPRVFAVEGNHRFTGTASLLNILCHRAGIGGVYEHAYQAFYAKETDLQPLLNQITPNGRKRYAKTSENLANVNKEGLDKTVYKEDGFYTHAIFEEIKQYNVIDDRKDYKHYMEQILEEISEKLQRPIYPNMGKQKPTQSK